MREAQRTQQGDGNRAQHISAVGHGDIRRAQSAGGGKQAGKQEGFDSTTTSHTGRSSYAAAPAACPSALTDEEPLLGGSAVAAPSAAPTAMEREQGVAGGVLTPSADEASTAPAPAESLLLLSCAPAALGCWPEPDAATASGSRLTRMAPGVL